MKISIDFLIDQLSPYLCFPLGESAGYNLQDVFDRAKETHKDEIVDAYLAGEEEWLTTSESGRIHYSKQEAYKYYNDTFTK